MLLFDNKGKPHLIIDPKNKIKFVFIDCFVEDTNAFLIHNEGSGYKISYIVNRVIIKNKSSIGASNCKVSIINNSSGERVSWSLKGEPGESSILSHSTSEVDLCALLFKDLDLFNQTNRTSLDNTQLNALLARHEIPRIISPTEYGFNSSLYLNRRIQSGEYAVEVTCINGNPLKINVTISDHLNRKGIFVSIE